MNNEKTRNDFLFFQNEMLGDMKKMETKISQKISQITSTIDTKLLKKSESPLYSHLVQISMFFLKKTAFF